MNGADGVEVGATPLRLGVGMTVAFGLGDGMPFGYESWKISSCAPSRKLYKSL